jgi:hypothetical protein
VEGSCEHGNEPSVSIKYWGISLVTERLLVPHDGLSLMKLNSSNLLFSTCLYSELI